MILILTSLLFSSVGYADYYSVQSDWTTRYLYRVENTIHYQVCSAGEDPSRTCAVDEKKSMSIGKFNQGLAKADLVIDKKQFPGRTFRVAYGEFNISPPAVFSFHDENFLTQEKKRLEVAFRDPLGPGQTMGSRMRMYLVILNRYISCDAYVHEYLLSDKIFSKQQAKQRAEGLESEHSRYYQLADIESELAFFPFLSQ